MSTKIDGTLGVIFPDNSSQNTAATGFGFKNRIINGSCLVQQRAAVTISGGYQYGAVDRFLASGGGTPTAGSITSVATTATVSGQALAITGYSSTGTGTPPTVQQRIEQKNCYDLRSGAVTISALVYQDTGATLTYALGLVKFGSVDVYSGASLLGYATMSVSSVPSGVWTRIIGTYTFGVNDCDNGIALGISVPAYNGSISSKNFYYGEIQLEKGSTATSFDYRPYGTELALCQRYAQFNIASTGYATTTTAVTMPTAGQVEMRAGPSATLINSSSRVVDFGVANRNISAISSTSDSTVDGLIVYLTVATTTTSKPQGILGNTILLTAEL